MIYTMVTDVTCKVVIDPFCGRGTVLALANELGVAALGVDVDAACVKAAERLDILKLRAAETQVKYGESESCQTCYRISKRIVHDGNFMLKFKLSMDFCDVRLL